MRVSGSRVHGRNIELRLNTLWTRRCLLIAVSVILVGASWLPALAFDLGISPPDIHLKINKGEQYHGELYIYGSDSETVDVKAYPMDWALTTNGSYQFLPVGTVKRSASSWITFSPANFRLLPKRGQKVLYTVKIPDRALGSYWGNIMFDTNPTLQKGRKKFQIAVAGRLAFVIRIDINGSPAAAGSIEKLNASWNPESRKLVATFRVKNNGDSFIRFTGHLEIKDVRGKKAGEVAFKEGYILPDSAREFSLKDSELILPPGVYVGLAIADFGERSLKAVQTTFEVKTGK